mgnify:CR=1 FL=1
MIQISQKSQYALRAVYELARRREAGGPDRPVTATDIADAQAVPPKFLELILAELARAGVIESRRGPRGGYRLVRDPAELAVGTVLELIEGPMHLVTCETGEAAPCSMRGDCAFVELWNRAEAALAGVFDTTTFADLVKAEQEKSDVPNFSI